MAEIEKRQRLTTIIGAAVGAVAILLGAAALALALVNRSEGATQEDIDALNQRLDGIQTEVKSATEQQLQSVSDSIAELRSEVEALGSSGGKDGKQKGKDSKSSETSPQSGAAPQVQSSPNVSASVSSPSNGALRYSPSTLRVGTGQLSIAYSNPSRMPHNLVVAKRGKVLGKTRVFTKGSATVSVRVRAGQYVFYCSVPGHRGAGMQGDLVVGG